MRTILLRVFLAGGVLLASRESEADTLFLKNGSTLKIKALMCDATTCVATLTGGDVDVRASDVIRVEPDEVVDPEPGASAIAFDVPAAPSRASSIEELIAAASRKYALPVSLVRAVARAESATSARAVSLKGASGVMQLMPATAVELGVNDVFDAAQNIDAGTRLLRQHLEKYNGRLAEALAAYNAGMGAVARYKGVPPYKETRGYIRKVVKDFERAEKKSAEGSARAK